jgi:hypothetical protein
MSVMTGCAATGPAKESPDASRAYNLANAAGIEARDTVLGAEEYNSAIGSMVDVSANTLLLRSSTGLGMSDWGSFGAGLAMSMLSLPGTAERNSLFGWMPVDLASNDQEAQKVFANTYAQAAIDYFEASNTEYFQEFDEPVKVDQGMIRSIALIAPDLGCPDLSKMIDGKRGVTHDDAKEMCLAVFIAKEPRRSNVEPPEVLEHSGPVYQFSAGHKTQYSRFLLALPNQAEIDPVSIAQGISAYLPDWAFIYLASERKTNPAVVLDHGKAQLFIKKG